VGDTFGVGFRPSSFTSSASDVRSQWFANTGETVRAVAR
jgi:hypothetical protein